VRIHFIETAEDTLYDKILHLVQNEVAAKTAVYGTMGVPQMGQPLEGSSL